MTDTQKLALLTVALLALAAIGAATTGAGRYTVTCYDPAIPESQLIAEWSGLNYADCNETACTFGTRHHKTAYIIPQGIACAVENEP